MDSDTLLFLSAATALGFIVSRRKRRRKLKIDAPILRLGDDLFSMRSLLDGGVVILGRPGSGKTSSSGRQLARGILSYPRSGGLILASSPTDLRMWRAIFKECGREKDLVCFGPRHPHVFNLTGFLADLGADPRDLAKASMTIGESKDNDDLRTGTGNSDPFWPQQNRLSFETAFCVLKLAGEAVTLPNLQEFMLTAAQTGEELTDAAWQGKYHNQCIAKAKANARSEVDQIDLKNATDRWLVTWPTMEPKVRSSVEAGVTGITSVFCSGMVRVLLSAEQSTLTPRVMEQGKWVFVDAAVGEYGSSGAFILNSWRYATQRMVLKRDPDRWTNPIIIWADEVPKIVNSGDMFYLQESRKFGGASVFLAQSMKSFEAVMGGDKRGEAMAKAMLGCFSTKILHAIGDSETASWAANLIGREMKTLMNFHPNNDHTIYDHLTGQGGFHGGGSQHLENIVEANAFMTGLATGGPPLYAADAYVLRTGLPWSTGQSFLRVRFSQK